MRNDIMQNFIHFSFHFDGFWYQPFAGQVMLFDMANKIY